MRKKERIIRDENGYIVVETVMSFTLLIIVMVVIMSLINIVAVRASVQNAITQTSLELSTYAYITTLLTDISDDDETKSEIGFINVSKDVVKGLSDGITNFAHGVASKFTGLLIDQDAGKLMEKLNGASNKAGRDEIMQDEVGRIFVKYLCHDLLDAESQANDYLLRYGVVDGLDGLEFKSSDGSVVSTMRDEEGDTIVIVSYKIRFNIFRILQLPLNLEVQQTAKTKAWIGNNNK